MEASTASAIFSAIAILISIFGTIRVARSSSLIQQWTYRQKVGEELTTLSSLLTQSQLISQRQQQRNDMVEREANRLQLRSPNDPSIKATLDALAEAKAEVDRKARLHAETRETLAHVWESVKPTADQLAKVQQMKASVQHELLQLQAVDQQLEEQYKKFMATAALVP
jgi:chromosome segregation ATPase